MRLTTSLILSTFLSLTLFAEVKSENNSTTIENKNLISYDKHLKSYGRNVMFIFGKDSCGYCKVLKEDITKNIEVGNIIRDKMQVYYIPLDNGEHIEYTIGDGNNTREVSNVSLKMQFGSKISPTIVMFDENWKRIIQLPGYTHPARLKSFLKYVIDDIYKTKDLGTYLKEEGII